MTSRGPLAKAEFDRPALPSRKVLLGGVMAKTRPKSRPPAHVLPAIMGDCYLKPIHSLRMVWRKVVAKQLPSGPHKAPGLALLPVEVILAIVEYLDERSKVRVLQTNHYFRNLVEPILYRHIFLDPDQPRRNSLRSHLLHDTLLARRDLLPYVLTYHGPLVSSAATLKRVDRKPRWYKSQTTQPTYRRDLRYDDRFEIAKTIFSGTVNIRELHFTDWASLSFAKLWESFDTTKANMNIEKLVLNGGASSPHLISILRAQPRLKHLDLSNSWPQLQELQNTDIPELSALKATISDAALIIPGRPVKKVELTWGYVAHQYHPQNPAGEALFRRLALSACDITDFTVWFHRSWSDEVVGGILRLIGRHLPRVERLCLSIWGGVAENLVGPLLRSPSISLMF
ncbi:hypothetical protein FRC05_005933 [Tulasnella sp. 425]|nr:hypothetical protein FRC05_005933 [Tulasnella sp. 425]